MFSIKIEDVNILQDKKLIEDRVELLLSTKVILNKEDLIDDWYPTGRLDQLKALSNAWGEITNWSINLGNHHFAITITNTPFAYEDGLKNSLKTKKIESFYWYISDKIYECFPSTVWFFIVSEKTKNSMVHFHAIIAIKNFIDYSYTIKNNLYSIILKHSGMFLYQDSTSEIDLKIETLTYFKDIKNWVMYMHKDIFIWKYSGMLRYIWYYSTIWLYKGLGDTYDVGIVIFEDTKEEKPSINMELFDLKRSNSLKYLYNDDNDHLDSITICKNHLNPLDLCMGIKLTHNKLDQRTLINILQYYLILNKLYIYNDNIYTKVESLKISYKLVGSLVEILYNKFQENVIPYFISNFNYYFDGFDFNYLLTTHFIKSKQIIESLKDISTNKIEPDFSLIEFLDGIYSITYNKFIENKFIMNDNEINKHTIKYYNKSYEWVRHNKPKNWIKGLQNALNIKDNNSLESDEQFLFIIKAIASIFQIEKLKRSTLFIYGPSNTGKTSLIVNPLENYFGKDNIGSIISAKNFKWQSLINKIIAIIDEGRYNQSMSSDLLKITGQENIIIEKKYSKEHIEIKPLPLFILSNNLFKDNDELVNKALYNRIMLIEFINILTEEELLNSSDFKIKIKNEEANIIIYCNKLFFKIFKEKKKYKIKDKILPELVKSNHK